jgi:hypothetical protein
MLEGPTIGFVFNARVRCAFFAHVELDPLAIISLSLFLHLLEPSFQTLYGTF